MKVSTAPSNQFGQPRLLSFSGRMVGTTVSIIVKQKSPQRSQAKSPTSPSFV